MADADWCNLIGMWVDGRDWPENYGPAPDQDSNFVPKKVARKYTGAIAARNQQKVAANGADDGVDFDSE